MHTEGFKSTDLVHAVDTHDVFLNQDLLARLIYLACRSYGLPCGNITFNF